MLCKQSLACAMLMSALVVSGCVSSNSTRVGSETYPPRPSDYVIDVYVPVDAPVNVQQSISNAKSINDLPPNALIIGRIDTNGGSASGWDSVIADAKPKARELGGDGIVIKNWSTPPTGFLGTYLVANLDVVRYNP